MNFVLTKKTYVSLSLNNFHRIGLNMRCQHTHWNLYNHSIVYIIGSGAKYHKSKILSIYIHLTKHFWIHIGRINERMNGTTRKDRYWWLNDIEYIFNFRYILFSACIIVIYFKQYGYDIKNHLKLFYLILFLLFFSSCTWIHARFSQILFWKHITRYLLHCCDEIKKITSTLKWDLQKKYIHKFYITHFSV